MVMIEKVRNAQPTYHHLRALRMEMEGRLEEKKIYLRSVTSFKGLLRKKNINLSRVCYSSKLKAGEEAEQKYMGEVVYKRMR